MAEPVVPHQFFGDVMINGVPAPDGVLIEARVNGKYVSGTTTLDGGYGHDPEIFYVPDNTGTYEGKTIEFFVQDVKAGEQTFLSGESTRFDLSVAIENFCGDGICDSGESCSSCSIDCGTCSTGGSSSGGGGGGGGGSSSSDDDEETTEETGETTDTTILTDQSCIEDWICTEWTECFNNLQKRTCADENRCGTTENKPPETQSCNMGSSGTPGLIGFFSLDDPLALGGLLLIIIGAGIFVYYFWKKKKGITSKSQ